MAKQLYGEDHPWGQPSGGTLKTLAGITRRDLARFHHQWYRPNNAVITFVGDITPDEAEALAQKAFGTWQKGALPSRKLPEFPKMARKLVLVPVPNASQSQVWMGTTLPITATSADAIPLKVANYPLGGLFTSRLNLNLREAHGYSYGVFSSVRFDDQIGTLVARGGIVAKDTAPALQEYVKELTRFSNGQISDEELNQAKNAYIRSLPSVLETNDAVSSAINGLVIDGLPLDYYQGLPDKVQAVSKDEIAKVVTQYVKPANWPVVVAGPAEAKAELEKLDLGPVVEDNPESAAPKAKAASAHGRMMTRQKQAEMKKNPPPVGTKPTGKE
jgi:zinc protease